METDVSDEQQAVLELQSLLGAELRHLGRERKQEKEEKEEELPSLQRTGSRQCLAEEGGLARTRPPTPAPLQGGTGHSPDAVEWSDVTFPSINVVLQPQEAEAMLRAHDLKYADKEHEELTIVEINALHDLQMRLDAAVERQGGKAFVKVGMQSAKDVALMAGNARTQAILRKKLKHVVHNDANGQLLAFLESLNLALCVESGTQALQLLIASHRIYRELQLILSRVRQEGDCSAGMLLAVGRDGGREHEMHEAAIGIHPLDSMDRLVVGVRQFVPFEGAAEFRCFVRAGRLVAVSQYESGAFYPSLQEDAGGNALGQIESFFEHIRSRLLPCDCLVDVALLGREAYLVEISAWNESLSACLFDWHADAEELADVPVSFRIREEPLDDPLSAIPSRSWRTQVRRMAEDVAGTRVRRRVGWAGLAGAAALLGTAAALYARQR